MLSPPEDLTLDDFERIEAAVMETERGRWFLQEYARRLRAAETTGILAAVERLATRDADALNARRGAAEATVAMIEALQSLSAFALGVVAREEVAARSAPGPRRTCDAPGDLERRLSALKELDELDVEAKVKLFG